MGFEARQSVSRAHTLNCYLLLPLLKTDGRGREISGWKGVPAGRNSKYKGSKAGTNMKGRGTAWRPVGLEQRERGMSEAGMMQRMLW